MKENNTAIKVEGLSKVYSLGIENKDSNLLKDEITSFFSKTFSKIGSKSLNKKKGGKFWALRNINFNIKKGEVVGIIGSNGAGKSTILKILSRITYPSSGTVTLKGRVASLLEVGTGFNPELTGRENIYLNGAILGMSKREISSKIDKIIEFAEIGEFIEVPVKRYSSGMYIRLAFSIAAHLESEILLIDEVLAVGDAKFQKRCLGKVDEVTKGGNRTVIFVSHDLGAIGRICKRTILLKHGKMIFDGPTNQAIKKYMSDVNKSSIQKGGFIPKSKREGTHEIFISSIDLLNSKGKKVEKIVPGEDMAFRVNYELDSKTASVKDVLVGLLVKSELGAHIFVQHNILEGVDFGEIKEKGFFQINIKSLSLIPGTYFVNFSLIKNKGVGGNYFDNINDALVFEAVYSDFYNSGVLPSPEHGPLMIRGQWKKS